jgi:hypothetical protein
MEQPGVADCEVLAAGPILTLDVADSQDADFGGDDLGAATAVVRVTLLGIIVWLVFAVCL